MRRRTDNETVDIAIRKLMLSLGLDSAADTGKRSPISPKLREYILNRDGRTCSYCGEKLEPGLEEVDHRVPRAFGGSDSPENLVAACWYCNRAKGSLLVERRRLTPEQACKVFLGLVKHPGKPTIERQADEILTGRVVVSGGHDTEQLAMERLIGVTEIRRRSKQLTKGKLERRPAS